MKEKSPEDYAVTTGKSIFTKCTTGNIPEQPLRPFTRFYIKLDTGCSNIQGAHEQPGLDCFGGKNMVHCNQQVLYLQFVGIVNYKSN